MGRPRRVHINSREAFEAVQPALPSLQRRIVTLYQQYPAGLTSDEVQVLLGYDKHQTVSGVTSNLKTNGVLVFTGQRRSTRSGEKYKADVLVLFTETIR